MAPKRKKRVDPEEEKCKKEREEAARQEFELKCRVIDEVREYPEIYNKAHPKHLDKNRRIQIFTNIGAIVGLDGEYI